MPTWFAHLKALLIAVACGFGIMEGEKRFKQYFRNRRLNRIHLNKSIKSKNTKNKKK